MSKLQLENSTLSSLEQLLTINYNKLLELELEETPNDDAIELMKTKINEILVVINAKNETKTADLKVQKEPKVQIQKELQIALRDNVPTFQSGVDVHSFINALELYYDLYVAPNKSADFEKMFVRLSTGKMSVEYGSTMTKYKPSIEDFESMKSYLKTHHSSKMSCYQTLDVMWELQMLEAENLRDFARRLDEKAVESRNIIEAKFECFLKSKTADENIESADKNMTSKDVFNMFSGQIFLQMLKAKSPHIYNQIVNDLDAVWNAVDIANLAMSYEVRMAKDPDQNQALAPSSLTADSKNSEKSRQTCWWFINGKCKMGEKCTRNHDPTLKKSFETAGLKFNASGKVVQNDNSNEYQPAEENGRSLVATLNSQNFRE